MAGKRLLLENPGKVFDNYFERNERPLQFDASTSGSEDNYQPSEYGRNGLSLLKLSGRIISVTFTIPYSVRARKGRGDWDVELSNRHEHSVQFDALAHLSSLNCPWDHTIVGWTGEVALSDTNDGCEDILGLGSVRDIPLQPGNNMFVEYHSKERLEQQLYNAELKTVPVCHLCPTFYYNRFPQKATLKAESGWSDYCSMIDSFADRICDIYRPGDIVLVHDYHLMMLPQVLRRRLPGMYLVFSLNTSCPTYKSANAGLARLTKVLTGALGSNMIAFQAPKYFVEFASWCTREFRDWTSYWATRALEACVVFPLGIDVSRVTSTAQREAVGTKCDSLRSSFRGKKIIISYNTLDARREMDDVVMGFDRLLTQVPRWKEKVVLLQIICSSRAEDSIDESSVGPVSELIDQTNGRHDSCGFEHVQCYNGPVSELEYYALLRAGDTAIFPSASGGLATAALEYIICQPGDNKRPIISDTNPITHQLPEAITYRPSDINSISRAINYALMLSDWPPMAKPHHKESDGVDGNTAEYWMNSVLHSLAENLLKCHFQTKLPVQVGPCDPRPFEGESIETEWLIETVNGEDDAEEGTCNRGDGDGEKDDGGEDSEEEENCC
ncbi:glycosyltransferase family 20 domain-containing protein [Trichoderma ceciliae]